MVRASTEQDERGNPGEPALNLVPVPADQGRRFWSNRETLAGLLLLLAVLLVYQPALHAGYIWDDDKLLTANPAIVGSLGLKDVWTTRAADICPLTITTFWAEHKIWGLAPLPYHLVNVLLHAACALLLWRVLAALEVPGAWLGAALWALHPVQVESVAWISEMKNTESGVFYLLAILCFVQARDRVLPLGATVLCAGLAMASKSSTMVLPAVLCLLTWWSGGRWRWRTLATVAGVFVLAMAAGGLSVWTQTFAPVADAGAGEVRHWPQRLAVTGDITWFYLGKLAWPQPLMIAYPRWQIDTTQYRAFVPVLTALAGLFVLLTFWRQQRAWASAWLLTGTYFLTTLSPVLGLVDIDYFRHSFVSDHFLYLASMAPLALVGAGIARILPRCLPGGSWLLPAAGAALLLALGLASRHHAWIYENQEVLWKDTLAKNPHAWVGYDYLATDFLRKGQREQAIAEYKEGLENNPRNAQSRINFGVALIRMGRAEDAIVQFQDALKLDDRYATAHSNLGYALTQRGRWDEAVTQYQAALKLEDRYPSAHNNYGLALMHLGHLDEAIAQYQKALELSDHYASAHSNLANAYMQRGEGDRAIVQYQEALEDDSADAVVHHNFGVVLASKGRLDEAVAQLREAVRLNPGYRRAREDLAAVEAASRQSAGAR